MEAKFSFFLFLFVFLPSILPSNLPSFLLLLFLSLSPGMCFDFNYVIQADLNFMILLFHPTAGIMSHVPPRYGQNFSLCRIDASMNSFLYSNITM